MNVVKVTEPECVPSLIFVKEGTSTRLRTIQGCFYIYYSKVKFLTVLIISQELIPIYGKDLGRTLKKE